MRTILLIAALSSGGFAVVGPLQLDTLPVTQEDVEPHFENHDQADDIDLDGGVLAVEVPEGSSLAIPDMDHGDVLTLVSLNVGNEAVEHRDMAGVLRTPAGRPVDARPGSLEAAQTGMQHDLGSATVTNTVSTEPTPSPFVQEAVAADPDLPKQPAPQAQEPTEGGGSGTSKA